MITFHRNDMVTVEPIIMNKNTYHALEENLVMFYTGITHDANQILAEQKQNITKADKADNLLQMCGLAKKMKESLEKNDILDFGQILIDFEYEIVMVVDCSHDKSYEVMQGLQRQDANIYIYKLSRNFGSHAAILCGLSKCTGDCAVVKAADLQEPTELILKMVEQWKKGFNVVLVVREGREEGKGQTLFANL